MISLRKITSTIQDNILKQIESNPHSSFHAACQWIVRLYAMIVFSKKYQMTFAGREYIPHHNNYIIVSNHYSYDDPPLICLGAYNHPVAFIAKEELFTEHGRWFTILITLLGAIAINRQKPKPSTIKSFIKAYKRGWVGSIFIEGTRNESYTHMTRINQGAAFLARIGGGLDVLPVGISLKGGNHRDLIVNIGKPIPYDATRSDKDYTLLMGAEIARLAGLEFSPIIE
jgi:1-acyl-sn-glycerol-3-phosphate acyltransferase